MEQEKRNRSRPQIRSQSSLTHTSGRRSSRHRSLDEPDYATHGTTMEGTFVRHPKRTRILILAISSFVVIAIVVSILLYVYVFQSDPCKYESSPTEYEVLLCERSKNNVECNFDTSICSSTCVLGYEENEFSCPISCDCATKGNFEVDIAFNPNNIHYLLTEYSSEIDNAFKLKPSSVGIFQRLWDLNVVNGRYRVPYLLSYDIRSSRSALNAIESAIRGYSVDTCIDFRLRKSEPDYVEIVSHGKGCRSSIGRVGGRQTLTLSSGCYYTGTVQHELMHVLGFWHEHSRPDRNDYITVQTSNIDPAYLHNFKRRSYRNVRLLDTTYDKSSVTHYGGYAFAKAKGTPTIIDKATKQPLVSNRLKLSVEDIKETNILYPCDISKLVTSFKAGDHWTTWLSWQSCSASCGLGQSFRFRECKNGAGDIVYSGRCSGKYYEDKECEGAPCIVGKWASWSPCSVTCGVGEKTRQSCCYPTINYDKKSCTMPACTTSATGTWLQWKEWGRCSQVCGTGWQIRSRDCSNSTGNVWENRKCPWKLPGASEFKKCADTPCAEFDSSGAGTWAKWKPWSSCSETCGTGIQLRTRECVGNYPGVGGCSGSSDGVQVCSWDFDCERHEDSSTPVAWGPWSAWSLCTAQCGVGTKSRRRTCYRNVGTSQVVSDLCGGGKSTQTGKEACEKEPCAIKSKAAGSYDFEIKNWKFAEQSLGLWTAWSGWSDCTRSCNAGVKWRKRDCLYSKQGKEGCSDPAYNLTRCNTQKCELVEYRWSQWSAWSSCSASCHGNRQRERKYECIRSSCQKFPYTDVSLATEACNTGCKKNNNNSDSNQTVEEIVPRWSIWSSWSSCTKSCDSGTRWRLKVCIFGENGEEGCTEPSQQPSLCNTDPCPTHWNGREVFCDKPLQVLDFNGDGLDDLLCVFEQTTTFTGNENPLENRMNVAINMGGHNFKIHHVVFESIPFQVICSPSSLNVPQRIIPRGSSQLDVVFLRGAFRAEDKNRYYLWHSRPPVYRRSNKGVCGIDNFDSFGHHQRVSLLDGGVHILCYDRKSRLKSIFMNVSSVGDWHEADVEDYYRYIEFDR